MNKTIKRSLQAALVAGGIFALLPTVQVEAQGIGLRKLDDLLVGTSATIAKGKTVYAAECATCHGANGQGEKGFTGAYKYGAGPVQIYNAITKGSIPVSTVEGVGSVEGIESAAPIAHPVFAKLTLEDRWAVTHYVRSLSDTEFQKDPTDVMTAAQFEAQNGVCDVSLKAKISEKVKPTGDAQIAKAKEIYAGQCSTCHGAEGKGDGAAAGALKPPPRNFWSATEKWTNSTSPLAIFDSLTRGIEGTSMAPYSSLSEEDRWALVHLVRSWIPAEARTDATEDEVLAVCRALSTPAKPDSVSVDVAMKAMIADQAVAKDIRHTRYGTVMLQPDANASAGEAVYTSQCASCHGADGVGSKQGPYGAHPPYLFVSIPQFIPAMAGGTDTDFAARSVGGVHTTIPNMTASGQLSGSDWKNLHAYVAKFKGNGKVKVIVPKAPPTEVPASPTPKEEKAH